ncbi:MAG: 16S rRNA (cytidine(1402)-2'-O)-methyltransferase [Streptococcaceae bacterium]|nr:16S rRNA (cytidine(1402)-2'-O)-methyltransferase [Streptococcaceae bacterium]
MENLKVQSSFRGTNDFGKLFLVPTPIGNLEDMTFRAVNTLSEADLICAEDTRNTLKLLNHFEIKTPMESFHEHNWAEKIPKLLKILKAGQSIAQVSDAGMPSISDPGHELVMVAIEEEIPVVALPGASAGITALIASGINPQPHIFYGFLPRKKSGQVEFFESKKNYPESQIFYESPLRLVETLSNMLTVYGNRQVVLTRELTKIYEEYRRGPISELIEDLRERPAKGECILIVSGATDKDKLEFEGTALEEVHDLIVSGEKTNAAIKKVAKLRGLNRQELYAEFHELKTEAK